MSTEPAADPNLGGNRRLNHAVHIAAITQARYPGPGPDYYRRKLTEGKTRKEALRALKRRISDTIYRQLVADADATKAAGTGPGGQAGAALSSSAADRSPVISTSEKPQPGPVTTDPTPAAPAAGKRSSARSRRPRNAPTRRRRQAHSA